MVNIPDTDKEDTHAQNKLMMQIGLNLCGFFLSYLVKEQYPEKPKNENPIALF